jgi:glutamyl-tRNA reductase
MVDIAVPRDIEPEVGDLNDVYLYTVDDLKEIIDESYKSRQEAAHQAEQIIDIQVTHFMGWIKSLESVPTIRNYREQIRGIREAEIAKARRLLAQGVDPEEVVQQLARTLCNKIIHSPTVQMRKASYEGRADLIKAAHELLGIKIRNK